MHKNAITVFSAMILILAVCQVSAAPVSDIFAGQDLHLSADEMVVYEGNDVSADKQVLRFNGDFELSIGDNDLSSDEAIVWVDILRTNFKGVERVDYHTKVFLSGHVSVVRGKAGKTTSIRQAVIDQGQSLIVSFKVTGEIYAMAAYQSEGRMRDLRRTDIYLEAISAAETVILRPRIAEKAVPPGGMGEVEMKKEQDTRLKDEMLVLEDDVQAQRDQKVEAQEDASPAEPQRPGDEPAEPQERQIEAQQPGEAQAEPGEDQAYQYPVNIAAIGDIEPAVQSTALPSGLHIMTIRGRFYMWQRMDEGEGLVEFQADNAVVFYSEDQFKTNPDGSEELLASGQAEAVYLQGNIVMSEGPRTIRAQEIYYDFKFRRAVAVQAEMRNFDVERGIPIYLRAEKLKKVSDNVYEAEDIMLTTSEFYLPQVSMHASSLVLTDLTTVETRAAREEEESKYDATLNDVRVKYGKSTIFAWPKIRTDFERPDLPIRRVSVGDDNDFGFSLETNWYLSRLLGLREPEGVETDLAVDYYGKRGLGTGVAAEYERQDYYGWVSSYVIRDSGEDDLGRISSRENLEPESDWRGRFTVRHRHYLPYNWQATMEVSYLSDKNFLESFYRDEFDNGKSQETLLYLKRLEDNYAFSILNKVRINDFASEIEELPTVEYHRSGESFWDHRLTYYGDTQVSRLRDRFSSDSSVESPEQFYTFATTRHEVDAPLTMGQWRVVPYTAGTFAYEDLTGFDTGIDGSTIGREDTVWLGEAGVRASTMFWSADPEASSRFWDIEGLRHIVQPHVEAVSYYDNDDAFEMRDLVNVGLSQRWQTHRNTEELERTVNWMRLDVNATFLSDTADDPTGAAKYIFNNPSIPVAFRRDRADFGLQRNMLNADYMWRMSDVTTLVSDISYDIEAGTVEQLDVGFARYVYPDLSYYIGNRYLKRVVVSVPADDIFEQGSNSLIAAITYRLNDRYTATIAQEYNFDYGKNVRSELSLIRQYHRLFYGLTLSVDESRDRQTIMFSVWPQGVDELALGSRDYVGLSRSVIEME